jgi:two-component system chemotaxis response regulator CheY
MRILVVEDCRTTRRLLGIYLRSLGYEVLFAENGLDALEKLGTDSVNLIMTDLNMPYMDGIELTRSLKSDPAWAEIPVIVVTTEQDANERERALGAGASSYIIKPVTAEVMARGIRDIMGHMFTRGGDSNG